MKRVLLTLLAVFVALGLFAAVGYSGYRLGYTQGIHDTADGELLRPGFGRFDEFRRDRMPMWSFGFERGPMRGVPFALPMMGWGFGLFSLLGFLWRIAILALIVWFAYWLFTRSGWRLTREPRSYQTPPPSTPATGQEEN
jgi:hypothetical protein